MYVCHGDRCFHGMMVIGLWTIEKAELLTFLALATCSYQTYFILYCSTFIFHVTLVVFGAFILSF